MKVAAYIDGFNAYHAIAALNQPLLKWLDYHSLATSLLREGETLERVVFYTALNPWSNEKRARHSNYIAALKHTGVEVVESRFTRPSKFCQGMQQYCKNYEEKQTDVAIAVDVLTDIMLGKTDRVLLFTADSDQIPLVKRVRAHRPESIVFLVAPPGRLGQARELGRHCSGIMELKPDTLRKFILAPAFYKPNGKPAATLPAEYGIHPSLQAALGGE